MLTIADKQFDSHLVMGTGGASSQDMLEQSLVASGTQLTTGTALRVPVASPSSSSYSG